MKAVFLRCGLDSRIYHGQAQGIFTSNCEFDYFPRKWEIHRDNLFFHRTYDQYGCRLGGTLSDFLPESLIDEIPYANPHFNSKTFEARLDHTGNGPGKALRSLEKGDFIVFYESFKLFTTSDQFNDNNFVPDIMGIIGFLELENPAISIFSDIINLDEITFIKRRFRGHPFLDYVIPDFWEDEITLGHVFMAGISVSGLFDRLLEVALFEDTDNNHLPVNSFFQTRWSLQQSLLEDKPIFANNPEQVASDLRNWMNDPVHIARNWQNNGWNSKFKF